MDSSAAQTARTAGAGRIAALDVIRGIAILGTLGTNIWIFTDPYGFLGSDGVPGANTDNAAQLWLVALTNGKFLALLSLMFGMGVAIQYRSAVRRRIRWPGPYLWRAALLLLDGFVNYVLIAEFDVLMGYAITGALVSWLLLTSPRTQRRVAAVFAALHVLLITGLSIAVVHVGDLAEDVGYDGPSPYATLSFGELALFRLTHWQQFRAEPLLIFCLSIAMFLIGARLFRAGVFEPGATALRRRLIIAGAVAAPLDLAAALWAGAPGLLLERYVIAPVVALGLLGLASEVLLRKGSSSWAAQRLQEVGRTALTCYMLQNLLGGALFYGWGLGLATALHSHHLLATIGGYLLVSTLITVFAHLWLRRFDLGPVEYLWKRAGALAPERPRHAQR